MKKLNSKNQNFVFPNEENVDDICAPEQLERESKFHSADFNCTNCLQTDCFYWVLYNTEKVE